MKRISVLILLVLSLSFDQMNGQSRRGPAQPADGDFTRRAIFNPPQVVWGRMQDECRGPDLVECVVSIMRQAGASTQAIEFTRRIDGDGYMDSFREMGKVDLATAFYPFRANTNDGTFLVNGSPSMISLEDLDRWGKIDIRTDPLYPAIVRRFPEVMLWSGGAGFETMQRLPGGGQRFVFGYVLLNGCHACDIAGYAHVGYDFDREGRFLGARLLRLTKPGKTRYQHPVRKTRVGPRSTRTSTNPVSLPLVAQWDGHLLRLTRDGSFVATQIERDGNNYTTKIWKPGQTQSILTLEGAVAGFSPDGRFVMTNHYAADYTQIFDLYELPSGQRKGSWRGWQSAVFSGDSRFIIANVGYREGKSITEYWSVEQGRRVRSVVNAPTSFSHDDKYSISVDDQKKITSLLSSETNRLIRQLPGDFMWFSPDDRLIATKEKAMLKIWQTATGELLSEVECWGDAYLSPDGEVVATEVFDYRRNKNSPIVKLSEVRGGKLLAAIDGKLTSPYYPFIKNGKFIVTDITDTRSVTKIWESANGQLVRSFEGGFRGFSSDGRFAITEIWWKGPEHTTKLWRAESGDLFANVEGYPMGFSPDSQFVFTGSKGVKVWQLP